MKKLIDFLSREKVLLSLILISGLFVRFYKIDSPIADWHSFRQSDTAAVGRIYLQQGINLLIPKYYDISMVQSGLFNPEGYRFVEFPLYSLLHVVVYKILPLITFEEAGRLLSIICSLITSFFLYKITKNYFSKNIALLTAFLFLLLPFNIYFTRVILPEPLAVMLGVLGVKIKLFSIILNYPPEEGQTIIRDQTRSTYLQEVVHPLKESLFINGFEPKKDSDTIIVNSQEFKQKIIIKLNNSGIFQRILVGILALFSIQILFKTWSIYFKRLFD